MCVGVTLTTIVRITTAATSTSTVCLQVRVPADPGHCGVVEVVPGVAALGDGRVVPAVSARAEVRHCGDQVVRAATRIGRVPVLTLGREIGC